MHKFRSSGISAKDLTAKKTAVMFASVALLVSACGGSDAPAASSPSAPAPSAPAAPEPAPDPQPLAGSSVTFVQGHSADGGFAQYVLMLAPCLEEELGATVTHESQPGAGSLIATTATFTAAADGTRIQLLQGPSVVANVVAGRPLEFEIGAFTQLGRVTAEPSIGVFGPNKAGVTMDDLVLGGESFRWASSGPGSSGYNDATLVTQALNLNAEIITGFDGSSDSILSLVARETDSYIGSLSVMPSIIAGDVTPWIQVASSRYAELPDVPTVIEVVEQYGLGDEAMAIAQAHTALGALGRLVIGPPGMSEDIATAITNALRSCILDPDFEAMANETGRPLDWAEPEEMEAAIATLLNAPRQLVEALSAE